MIVRPTDANGDMMPVAYSEQMLTENNAVAQVVVQRLTFYFGEWWEDETLGFRVPDFLADTVRVDNLQMLEKYITSYVLETEGVSGVDNAAISVEDRRMTYSCVVHTAEGSESVEVSLDGLL